MGPFRLTAGLRACQRKLTLISVLALGLCVAGCSSIDQMTRDPQAPPPPRTTIVAPPPPVVAQKQQQQYRPQQQQQPYQYQRPVATTQGPGATADTYRLGVGDKIRIQVHGEADLTMELTVSESGVVNYPFLGDIPILGRTVSDLQRTIDRGLRGDYLVNPDVRIVVIGYRNFYINGEVRLPGGYPYVPGLTVRQAATLAGGFTERASMRGISLYRETSSREKLPASLDSTVFPGDIVVVEQGIF